MTVVAFVRLMPNPPALVEIKKTWYAMERVLVHGGSESQATYVISPVGTGGTVTRCRVNEADAWHLPIGCLGFASAG